MQRYLYLLIGMFLIAILSGCQTTGANELDPERAALARLKLGLEYLAQADKSENNIKAAHYNLSLASQYSPNNPNVMLGLALFDQHVGEYDEANMIYQRITEMDPKNGLYLIHYASFLCATNRYAAATLQFNKAIALNRAQWRVDGLEQLGYCALQNNDTGQATEAFTALFKIDSNKKNKIKNVAAIYQQNGDIKTAQYLYNIAI